MSPASAPTELAPRGLRDRMEGPLRRRPAKMSPPPVTTTPSGPARAERRAWRARPSAGALSAPPAGRRQLPARDRALGQVDHHQGYVRRLDEQQPVEPEPPARPATLSRSASTSPGRPPEAAGSRLLDAEAPFAVPTVFRIQRPSLGVEGAARPGSAPPRAPGQVTLPSIDGGVPASSEPDYFFVSACTTASSSGSGRRHRRASSPAA